MKTVLQRVKKASVTVENKIIGSINTGLLIFVGISNNDSEKEINCFYDKILNLRIFPDETGKFDKSILDIKGEILIVSQFTLYADCGRGRRPSFTDAAPPSIAEEIYKKFVEKFKTSNLKIEEGQFQAMMEVSLV